MKKKKKIADVKEMALNHQVRVQEYGDQEILTLNRHVSLQGNLKLRTAGILKKVRSSQTAHSRSQQQYSPQEPLFKTLQASNSYWFQRHCITSPKSELLNVCIEGYS